MFIGEICNRNVVIASRDTSITQLAQLMREHHVGSIVITEVQNECNIPVGIITDRDLVIELLSKEIEPSSVATGDVMSTELITVRESNHVYDTLKLMRGKGIRSFETRLPTNRSALS